ncbi:MAG: hypothetical protein PVG03_09085 [Desulfarculaceae bacterium]|jgi:pyruvate formate lyase activating enzyme
MLRIGALAQEQGLLSLMHSNGYINPTPLKRLCQVLDAANIDLKGFNESYYRKYCGGELAPVLESLKILKRSKVHLEITNLIVPTLNDNTAEIKKMCRWLKDELGPYTPLHFFRFYPLYKLANLPPTPVATLEKARDAALSCGLKHVYIANVPGHAGQNTYCPQCGRLLIQHIGYMVGEMRLKAGKCPFCGQKIKGIWA